MTVAQDEVMRQLVRTVTADTDEAACLRITSPESGPIYNRTLPYGNFEYRLAMEFAQTRFNVMDGPWHLMVSRVRTGQTRRLIQSFEREEFEVSGFWKQEVKRLLLPKTLSRFSFQSLSVNVDPRRRQVGVTTVSNVWGRAFRYSIVLEADNESLDTWASRERGGVFYEQFYDAFSCARGFGDERMALAALGLQDVFSGAYLTAMQAAIRPAPAPGAPVPTRSPLVEAPPEHVPGFGDRNRWIDI